MANTWGLLSVIIGTLALLSFLFPWFSLFLAITSLYFGLKSRKKSKLGIIGIALSVITFGLFILIISLRLYAGFYSVVVFESCSMYHDSNFENWWERNRDWYENKEIEKEDFENFPMRNGFSKGDIIFILPYNEIKLGEVIAFKPTNFNTLIVHRIIVENPLATKGDNFLTNPQQLMPDNNPQGLDETNIDEEQIVGKVASKIPYVGWLKLIFYEQFKEKEYRGLCR